MVRGHSFRCFTVSADPQLKPVLTQSTSKRPIFWQRVSFVFAIGSYQTESFKTSSPPRHIFPPHVVPIQKRNILPTKPITRISILQPENIRQRRPSLLSQLCVSGLPPFHTTVTDTRANASNITPTILVKFGNLQQVCPQPRGTRDMIKNLLVSLHRCRASRSARRTI